LGTVRYRPPDDVDKIGGKAISAAVIKGVWADPEINQNPRRSGRTNEEWGDYSFCSDLTPLRRIYAGVPEM